MAPKSFVRTEMIAPRAAPESSVGMVGWCRANLFGSPLNTVLTVLALAFLVYVLKGVLPWILGGVWTADSLDQCREIMHERYGPNHEGACWAVVHERFVQLLFGFYPLDKIWRPILTFLCLLAALAPVLFSGLPRRMLAFTGLYPFLAVWLLWGGTIWGVAMAAAGFGLGFLAFRLLAHVNGILAVAAAILLPILWWIFGAGPADGLLSAILPIGIPEVGSNQFGGFLLSVIIGMSAISMSLPLGILLALGRQTRLLIVRGFCVGFIEFIRGVPLITLLFVASTLLNYFMPPGTNFDLIVRVIIMATLFQSAYLAEVVRGGLAALPKGQYEAGDSLGLDYWQAQRLVIMPQALKISIPAIVSSFIALFKDTTLVSIIGLLDPIGLSTAIRANSAWHGIVWELYGFIALMFFVFCFSMSRYAMYLERKLDTGHR